MRKEKANLVAQIQLQTNTYYVTDRDGGVLLDGIIYENVVIEWGDVPHVGNLGNGEYEVGSMTMILVNGEQYEGAGYRFDPTDVWNNSTVVVKRYINGTHFRFIDCIPYGKGIIKNYSIDQDKLSFTVEESDPRDDILLPGILCTDQGSLSDAEAQTTFKSWGNQDLIEPTDIGIFSIGELVKLTAPNGNGEYARIKGKPTNGSVNFLQFWENLSYHTSYSPSGYTNTVEKAFRYLPKTFVDKTVPMQYGDLTNTADGIFAKLVTVNEQIGQEAIIADHLSVKEFNNLGAWENGLKKYFQAQAINVTIEGDQAEYEIDGNTAKFRVDSTTTLSADILDTFEGVSVIQVADYTKIMYVNEDDIGTSVNQELISTNIIAINDELMVVMGKPTSNQVYVERGFNNTPIGIHYAGDKIFQSAKYSSRNLLIFTERFMAKMVTNLTYRRVTTYGGISEYDKNGHLITHFSQAYDIDTDGQGKISNIKDDSVKNYTKSYIKMVATGDQSSEYWLLFDIVFPKIETDFDTIGWYPATKFTLSVDSNFAASGPLDNVRVNFALIDPNIPSEANGANTITADQFWFGRAIISSIGTETSNKDYYTSLDRSLDGFYLGLTGLLGSSNSLNYNSPLATISLSNLKDLNKKWKMLIVSRLGSVSNGDTGICEAIIYNVGFWVDFFIDFTEKVIMGSTKGRIVDYDIIDIIGGASPDVFGDLIENPVDVVAHILALELKYSTRGPNGNSTTEFTNNWETVHKYIEDSGNYEVSSPASPTPECAMSYGVDDERKKGWEFASWVASHFNLQITKTYDGLIDIVNLHQIYNNTPTGYEIKIEDILFLSQSGNARITINQTGTDLIYNDFVVKYKRNNSTGDYQETYILPDSYILVKSGSTLATARYTYYGGEKRTLTIESPFIYNEQEAQRLAEWKADDQAETHFWVDLYLDFMHYSEVNGLSNQYKVGDIIYLNGSYAGVDFVLARKFYIQNIIFSDSGREIELQAKSVDPVTTF